MDIEGLRRSIDQLDRTILALLNQRAELSSKVAQIKRTQNLPMRLPAREAQIMDGLKEANDGSLTTIQIHRIFGEIIQACREQCAESH